MKTFVFQKLSNQLILLGHHEREFHEWVETLEDKDCFEASFVGVGSTKTHAQLGWYFAGIVTDVIAGLRELGWTDVGYRMLLDTRVPLDLTTENVDMLLKTVYAISRGCDVPSKTRMSKERMSDFITCILGWAQENGLAINPPKGTY